MNAPAKNQLLLALLQTFVDAVKEGGSHGAPGGVLYSAVMDKMTLEQFQTCMNVLVNTGCLRRSGQLYFFVRDLR